MPNLRRIGEEAEDAVAAYLLGQGFTIVTRRKKMRSGELDIVALEGEVLVFVEVKQRSAPGYVPEESIGVAKARALQSAGEQYVLENGELDREVRYDLVAVDRDGLRHHRGIFAD